MDDELRPDRSSSSAPSIDPLDAALEKMEAARSAAQQNQGTAEATEQEVDEDDTTGTGATADGDPNDDDFEDDDDTAAVNTPDADDEDADDELPEPQHTRKPAKTSTPGDRKQAEGSDSDDDGPPLSRKQRGKLIEELREQLNQEQEAKRRLEDSLKTQREEDERLSKEVDRALGTQADFDKAIEDGLNGDESAQERARIWKANRAFYGKLVTKADRQTREEFLSTYWSGVAGLPGVTEEALKAPSLADILKNLYDAGVTSTKGAADEEIEKLKNEVETWRGRYRKLKPQAAGASKQSPLGGGGSTTTDQPIDWKSKYIKNGELTDEAEAIVSQYGFEALRNPKLIKAR